MMQLFLLSMGRGLRPRAFIARTPVYMVPYRYQALQMCPVQNIYLVLNVCLLNLKSCSLRIIKVHKIMASHLSQHTNNSGLFLKNGHMFLIASFISIRCFGMCMFCKSTTGGLTFSTT